MPFQKGQSGNPGGRPSYKHISDALRNALANGRAEELAAKLLNLAAKGKPNNQLAAIQMIADRVEGKPSQQVKVEATLDENTLKRIADLGERLLP